MSEFEDKLNAVLNDPDSMAQIMKLAQSIGGKNNGEEQEEPSQEAGNFDISGLLSLAGQFAGADDSRYSALLCALRPYLKEERRSKLDRALRISKLSRLAKTALESGLIGEL